MVNNSGVCEGRNTQMGRSGKTCKAKMISSFQESFQSLLQGYKVDTVPSLHQTIILVSPKDWE